MFMHYTIITPRRVIKGVGIKRVVSAISRVCTYPFLCTNNCTIIKHLLYITSKETVYAKSVSCFGGVQKGL